MRRILSGCIPTGNRPGLPNCVPIPGKRRHWCILSAHKSGVMRVCFQASEIRDETRYSVPEHSISFWPARTAPPSKRQRTDCPGRTAQRRKRGVARFQSDQTGRAEPASQASAAQLPDLRRRQISGCTCTQYSQNRQGYSVPDEIPGPAQLDGNIPVPRFGRAAPVCRTWDTEQFASRPTSRQPPLTPAPAATAAGTNSILHRRVQAEREDE